MYFTWLSSGREEVFWVLEKIVLVLADCRWCNSQDNGNVLLGDSKLFSTLEHRHCLELSWVSPEVFILDSVQKGDYSGLSGLGELVRGTITVANFSWREVIFEVILHLFKMIIGKGQQRVFSRLQPTLLWQRT